MRYSNYIGILAGIVMVIAAAFPWIYIPSLQATVSGFGSDTITKFGKPVLMNIIFLVINIAFFLIPKLWAKRMNPFVGAINFAWALRNLLLLSTCRNGECPDRQIWLYIYFGASIVLLIMTLLPELKVNDDKN
ncbi:MAG: hypothetical protein ABL872_14390 [Lacibacter sp.]